jgi:hypothetical protein
MMNITQIRKITTKLMTILKLTDLKKVQRAFSLMVLFWFFCSSISAELGKDWSQATSTASWSGRYLHTSVTHDGKIWVIGGYDSSHSYKKDVWHSDDGETWTQATASAPWAARAGHTSVVFQDKIWVMGGGYYSGATYLLNDVWYSSDGITWDQATASADWSKRYYHTSVVYDNKIWIMGGMDSGYNAKNDVWYSIDGTTWFEATSSANWSARFYHTATVNQDKMWILGGRYSTTNKNDVWYSTNGEIWTQATASAPWSTRYSLTSVAHDGRIWIIGGNDYADKNDVWSSSDGTTWVQATSSADWSGREKHTSVVFDNKIWMIGGMHDVFPGLRDVWYSKGPNTVERNIIQSY